MSNIHFSTRLQQVVAQHAQQPAPRHLPPGALWVAAAMLIFVLSIGAGLWRLVVPPRSAPPNVTPAILDTRLGVGPIESGARPQEDATPPATTEAGPPTYAYKGVRGHPIPTAAPGVVNRPSFGAWWANKEYR